MTGAARYDEASPPNDEELGALIAGRFQVERILGRGGCGLVVAAKHVALGQHVAIKFLLPKALKSADAVERFAREARLAARLRSDHVVRVHDVGTLENGTPFMVMEYLEGEDLHTTLTSRGPLSIDDAVTYLLQACEAIAEAHALGIVHRDLKPANLFLAERVDGTCAIKVLDFGISKILPTCAIDQMRRTDPQFMLGSPGFMSPEQMRSSHDVDVRCDVWALGAILYQALSGRLAFDAASTAEIYSAILIEDPAPLAVITPHVPMGLSRIVERCLEKDPAKRFSDVVALADALVPFAPAKAKHHAERARALVRAARDEVPTVRIRLSPPNASRVSPRVETLTEGRPPPLTVHAAPTRPGVPRVMLLSTPTRAHIPMTERRWWLAIPIAAVLGAILAVTMPRAPSPAHAQGANVSTASEPAFELASRLATSRERDDQPTDAIAPTLVNATPKSHAADKTSTRGVTADERAFGRRK